MDQTTYKQELGNFKRQIDSLRITESDTISQLYARCAVQCLVNLVCRTRLSSADLADLSETVDTLLRLGAKDLDTPK